MSHKYTKFGSSKLESKIEENIHLIIKSFKMILPEDKIYSVLLTDELARGEGGVLNHKNKEHLLDSYNIVIVFDKLGFYSKQKHAAELQVLLYGFQNKLKINLNIRNLISRKALTDIKSIVCYERLKNDSKLIYGDMPIINVSKKTKNKKYDLKIMLLNVLNLLFDAKNHLFEEHFTNELGNRVLREINNAVIKTADILLFSENEFLFSFSKKLNYFKENKNMFPANFSEILEENIEYKLNGNNKTLSKFKLSEKISELFSLMISLYEKIYTLKSDNYDLKKEIMNNNKTLKNIFKNSTQVGYWTINNKWALRDPADRFLYAGLIIMSEVEKADNDFYSALGVNPNSPKEYWLSEFIRMSKKILAKNGCIL